MSKNLIRLIYLTIFILPLPLLLSSCGSDRIRSSKPGSDWSRGLRVGVAADLTKPSLVIEDDGDALFAWTASTTSNAGELGFARVSDHGQNLESWLIPVGESHLRGATLFEGVEGAELCWISDLGLRCSSIDPEDPASLSPYTLIETDDDIDVLSTEHRGLAWLTRAGDVWMQLPGSEREFIASNAINLNLQRSETYWLLTWAEQAVERETQVRMRLIPDTGASKTLLISRIPAGVLAGLDQEGLGSAIVEDRVCAVFGIEFTGGLEGGTAFTELNCYSLRTFELVFSNRPSFVIADQLSYEQYEGAFQMNRLAPYEISYGGLSYLPSEPIVDGDVLSFALSTPEQVRYQMHQQVAQLLIDDQQILGYQPVTATTNWSLFPELVQGADGYLHAVWLERAATNGIYYATTQPETAAVLNTIEPGEVTVIAMGIITDAITGLFLVPLALVWIGIAFVGLFAGTFISGIFINRTWADRIGFLVGIVLLWVSKLLFVPQIPTFIPFADWIPEIPSTWLWAYQIIWPLAIFILSTVFSTRFVRQRDIESSATQFLIFALLDVVMTALVYGVVLQGAT